MPVIEKNIILNAPPKTVFHYLSEPTHFLELCPNIIEISDLQQHSPGKAQFKWIVKMVGVRFEGQAELKHVHQNQQIDVHFWGGIRSNLIWRLQPLDEDTVLKIEVDYTPPPPLLKKHDENTVLLQVEDSVALMLNSLKTSLELNGDTLTEQK